MISHLFCFQCNKLVIVFSFVETARVTKYTVLLYACGKITISQELQVSTGLMTKYTYEKKLNLRRKNQRNMTLIRRKRGRRKNIQFPSRIQTSTFKFYDLKLQSKATEALVSESRHTLGSYLTKLSAFSWDLNCRKRHV